METVTLRAHFDGKQILLDEPFELEPNTELIVTVVPSASDEDRDAWTRFALSSLARAYGDDEPEYSRDQIKEANPEYTERAVRCEKKGFRLKFAGEVIRQNDKTSGEGIRRGIKPPGGGSGCARRNAAE